MRVGRRLRRGFRRITRRLTRPLVRSPLTMASMGMDPVTKKILNKSPLGQVLDPVASGILKNPLALVSPPGIGTVASLAGGARGPGDLVQLASALSPTAAFQDPIGRANALHAIAQSHAQFV